MLIISGTSIKQQVIGHHSVPCAACRQETLHRFQRNYSVKHVFWFPLFSYHTTYAKLCERCNLLSPTSEPAPGTAAPVPVLHRLGFVFPLGLFFGLPMMFATCGAIFGAGGASSGRSAAADTQRSRGRFHADDTDRAARSAVQGYFDRLGLRGSTVAATSAAVNGHTVRLLTVHYSRLKKVSHGDRVRLLEQLEQFADENYPDDEVFLGMKGIVLWGGHSHRKAGDDWQREVHETTPDPEKNAYAAFDALELAAAPTAAADARAEPLNPLPPEQ